MLRDSNVPPEGGWGWIVVAGAHVIQILIAGEASALGLFLVEWLEEFGESVSATSWTVSLMALLIGFLSPISNILANRYGQRKVCCIGAVLASIGTLLSAFATSLTHLYLTCIILGVGLGLTFAPSIMIVGVYFKSRFTLANGLAFAGVGIGQMVIPPLINLLISQYGWRGTFIILAALNMNLFSCACVFRPLRKVESGHSSHLDDENSVNHNQNEEAIELKENIRDNPGASDARIEYSGVDFQADSRLSLCCRTTSAATGIPELCRTMHYPVAVYTTFTIGVALYCGSVYLVPRALQIGYSKEQSALLLSLFGIGSLLGRFLHGVVIDFKFASAQTVHVLCLASTAVELLLTPISTNFALLGIFSFSFGFTMGAVSSLVYVISRAVSPTRLLAPVMGFTTLCFGTGNAFGTLLGGWLFDASGDYGHLYYTIGVAMSLATIIFLPTLCWLNAQSRQKV